MSRKPQLFRCRRDNVPEGTEFVRNDVMFALISLGWWRDGRLHDTVCWAYRVFTDDAEALLFLVLLADETARYDDVGKQFAGVLASLTARHIANNLPRSSVLGFQHHVTHPHITALFGVRLPEHWLSVTLVYFNTALARVYVEFSRRIDDDDTNEPISSIDGSSSFGAWYDWPCSGCVVRADYERMRKPQVSILINSTDWDPHSRLAYGWTDKKLHRRAVLVGPKRELRDQLNWMPAMFSERDPVFVVSKTDHVFCQKTWLDAVTQQPDPKAWSRWPFHYRVLFGACIALMPVGLPPYVVLEIVDWLPYMNRWAHGFKIEQIVAIHESIKQVLRNRETRPTTGDNKLNSI